MTFKMSQTWLWKFVRKGWGNATTGVLNCTLFCLEFYLQLWWLLSGHIERRVYARQESLLRERKTRSGEDQGQWMEETESSSWLGWYLKKSVNEGLRQWFLEELGKLGQSIPHRLNGVSITKRLMRTLYIKVLLPSQTQKS